ncbi:MAG: restriction endonuclease [Bacteroidetes bacterium]|jgi:restriction system protein|nr:restriction endonuclease [Bacteroidota bacterium]
MSVPKYDEMFNALLEALNDLGGSASISEMEDRVASILDLTDSQVEEIHRGYTSKFSYRLAWTRNYLKRYELLENSSRGIWSLTAKGHGITEVDKNKVKRFVKKISPKPIKKNDSEPEPEDNTDSWQGQLLQIIKGISPASFEKLCQRILRESGFINVEVTGKSGDGGIDGKGVVKIGGLLSFHTIFQAKRYNGSVAVGAVRDFRGAMVGRADKGLIITTGTFTRDARLESQRDGAPPIDLIDGDDLVEKLKDLSIGITVKEKIVEEIVINEDWFNNL